MVEAGEEEDGQENFGEKVRWGWMMVEAGKEEDGQENFVQEDGRRDGLGRRILGRKIGGREDCRGGGGGRWAGKFWAGRWKAGWFGQENFGEKDDGGEDGGAVGMRWLGSGCSVVLKSSVKSTERTASDFPVNKTRVCRWQNFIED